MKTVRLKTSQTVEAIRDQNILEQHGILAVVVPHYKSPTFYVGDNHLSELIVREDQLEEARAILGLPPSEETKQG